MWIYLNKRTGLSLYYLKQLINDVTLEITSQGGNKFRIKVMSAWSAINKVRKSNLTLSEKEKIWSISISFKHQYQVFGSFKFFFNHYNCKHLFQRNITFEGLSSSFWNKNIIDLKTSEALPQVMSKIMSGVMVDL